MKINVTLFWWVFIKIYDIQKIILVFKLKLYKK